MSTPSGVKDAGGAGDGAASAAATSPADLAPPGMLTPAGVEDAGEARDGAASAATTSLAGLELTLVAVAFEEEPPNRRRSRRLV
jgi:hypothetical protein